MMNNGKLSRLFNWDGKKRRRWQGGGGSISIRASDLSGIFFSPLFFPTFYFSLLFFSPLQIRPAIGAVSRIVPLPPPPSAPATSTGLLSLTLSTLSHPIHFIRHIWQPLLWHIGPFYSIPTISFLRRIRSPWLLPSFPPPYSIYFPIWILVPDEYGPMGSRWFPSFFSPFFFFPPWGFISIWFSSKKGGGKFLNSLW